VRQSEAECDRERQREAERDRERQRETERERGRERERERDREREKVDLPGARLIEQVSFPFSFSLSFSLSFPLSFSFSIFNFQFYLCLFIFQIPAGGCNVAYLPEVARLIVQAAVCFILISFHFISDTSGGLQCGIPP